MAQFDSHLLTLNDYFCIRNPSFQAPSEENESRILQITCLDGLVEIREKTITSLTRILDSLSVVSLNVNCEKEDFEAIKDFALIGHCFIQGKRLEFVKGVADQLDMKGFKEAIETIIKEQSNRVSPPPACIFTEAEDSEHVNGNCEQGNDVINLESSDDDQSTIETWSQHKREREVTLLELQNEINTKEVTIQKAQLSLGQAGESFNDTENEEVRERRKIEDSPMRGGLWWSESEERYFLRLCFEHTVVPNNGSAYVRGGKVYKLMVEAGFKRSHCSLKNKFKWLKTSRKFKQKYDLIFKDVSKDQIRWTFFE